MNILDILKPAPDAEKKVPEGEIKKKYHLHQAGVLIATCIGYIGYYIVRLTFTVQQSEIMEQYSLTKGDIGKVLACFGIGYGIAKLIMGTLSDRSNPRYYLALGLIGSAVLNIALGSTGNIYIMCFLMILMAITQGMGAPACQKLVQLWWSKKYKGTAYSVWSSAHNAGAFLCTASIQLAVFIFGQGDVKWTFYTASVISIIIAVLITIINSDRPSTVGLPSIAEYHNEPVILASGEAVHEDITEHRLLNVFQKYILKNKIVWLICLISMSFYLVRYGVMSWIPSYLAEAKGFDKTWAKWLLGIFELSAVPGVIIFSTISDKLKGMRGPVCLFSGIGLIACVAGYALSMNHTVIIVCLIVMGTLIYAPITLVGLMVNEAVPKFAVGASTGFMGFFQYILGEVCATAVIGMLVDAFGWNAANVCIIGAAILASVLLVVYIISHELKKKEIAAQLGVEA